MENEKNKKNEIIFLETVESTNSYIALHCGDSPSGTTIVARSQTAGRGQRGNSWEAEPGANVTMSMVLRPRQIPVTHAFPISEAVALAVSDAVDSCLAGNLLTRAQIKWPNDIYVEDRKIAGILIENSLRGQMIERSIVGIGLNVNQSEFRSDAPNPVSIKQLTGKDNKVDALAAKIAEGVMDYLTRIESGESVAVHEEYMRRLWRGRGMWPFVIAESGELLMAEVEDVARSGHIMLIDSVNRRHIFAFKEIQWEL